MIYHPVQLQGGVLSSTKQFKYNHTEGQLNNCLTANLAMLRKTPSSKSTIKQFSTKG
jgi:hypothetical protein